MKKTILSISKPDANKLQRMDAFIEEAGVGAQGPGPQPSSLPASVLIKSSAPAAHSSASLKLAVQPVPQEVAAERMTKFPLALPVWMHNKLRHLTIDRKESMSEYIVARLLLDPELQKPAEITASTTKQGLTKSLKTVAGS